MPGTKKATFQVLDEECVVNLSKFMHNDGIPQTGFEKVLSGCRKPVVAKTGSRGVPGTMNELAAIIQWSVYDNGGLAHTDLYELKNRLYRMPMKPWHYGFSVDAFKDLLS